MEEHRDFLEKFCIILPANNEIKTIVNTVRQIEKLDIPYLVIDDGSTDGTNQLLYLQDIPHLTQFPNQGKGAAVKRGAAEAILQGFKWILIVDADGQFLPEDIEKFDNELLWDEGKHQIFVGNRMADPQSMPKERLWVNKLMSLVITKLSGVSIPDTQCGLKMINNSVFMNLKLNANRFDFDSEVLIKAGRAGYKIKSIPIKCIYNEKRKSHIRPIIDFFRFLKVLITSL